MIPNRIRTRIGSTKANSTAAAPASRRGSPAGASRRLPSRRITLKASDGKPSADAREIRGTDQASRAAERGGQNLRVRTVGAAAQRRVECLSGRVDKHGAGVRRTTPNHKTHRVKDRGEVGEPLSDPPAHGVEALPRPWVASVRRLGHQWSGDGVDLTDDSFHQGRHAGRRRAGHLARGPDERVAARILLPATVIAATTQAPVGHHANVAGLAGHTESTAEQATLEHDAAADSGAENYRDDGVMSASGTEPVLGPRMTVRIVLDDDRQVDQLRDAHLQRLVSPHQVRREHDIGAVEIDPAGCADPDGLYVMAATQ